MVDIELLLSYNKSEPSPSKSFRHRFNYTGVTHLAIGVT